VVVANPKGAAGKTPTTIGLAGTFGELRGGNVLAWDNNETLGTLGLRVPGVQCPATAVDLLEQIDTFEQRAARRGDLAQLVRGQDAGNFHVLASDEDPHRMSQIDAPAFCRLHGILDRYYDVLVVDTGNNPRAANFTAAIDVADALVIPIAWSEDKVVTAGRLIDQLCETGHEDLVSRGVIVVTGTPGTQTTDANVRSWRETLAEQVAAVVEIPPDGHLAGGGPIVRDQLDRGTRRAYLAAAAAVAAQFSAADARTTGR
jgi:MinD-like ATPase involved in chromosome partitioning or flagellar assembly